MNIWITWGPELGTIVAFNTVSIVLFMVSMINDGVAQGDGVSTRFATSFASLVGKYLFLLIRHALEGPRILLGASYISAVFGLALTVRTIKKTEVLEAAIEDTGNIKAN